jgi:ABC-type uncharacterized transport system ATPase subunit
MERIPTKITSLTMEHITKRFPSILACDDISLSVSEGEIVGLVGENGAGKTTLMNILMGLYRSDEGRVLINGEEVSFKSPNDSFTAGLGMVHQQYMLIANMTVAENIALGYKAAWSPARLDLAQVKDRITEISQRWGLAVDPDAYIWQLSVGEQQRVELIKTLSLGSRFLILDEPTSALTPQETDELIQLLKRMKEELSIIFISHKLQEVKELCDRLVVLRHGRLVYSGSTCEHSAADIAALMTGSEVIQPINTEPSVEAPEALKIENLSVRSDRGYLAVEDLSLNIQAGQIVGLAGVSGNGQRELAEAINGLRRVESGSIYLHSEEITHCSAHSIIRKGMGYIPEERNVEGIVPPFSVKENLILKDTCSPPFSRRHLLNRKHIESNANELRVKFDIRCPNINVEAGSLSGGNIQKIILARELSRSPSFLVAVYPIRGLDLGAAQFIHTQLLDQKKRGVGILLISEELDELLALCDTIAVIYKGRIQGILDREQASRRSLGVLMAGVHDD